MTWDIPAMVESVATIINKVVPDADAGRKAAHEIVIEQLRQVDSQLSAQAEINKIEAASASVFVAGWRPFIGWVCGIALAWAFIISPTVQWAAALAGHVTPLPELDTATIFQLVLAMLGLSGWRSLDKIKGVDTKEVRKATLP